MSNTRPRLVHFDLGKEIRRKRNASSCFKVEKKTRRLGQIAKMDRLDLAVMDEARAGN